MSSPFPLQRCAASVATHLFSVSERNMGPIRMTGSWAMPVRELDRRIGSGVSVRRHTLRRWLGRGRLSDRRRSPNRSTDGSDYRLRRPPRNTAAAPHDASHASGLRSASASLRCSSRARPYHRCLYSARITIGLIYEELSSRKNAENQRFSRPITMPFPQGKSYVIPLVETAFQKAKRPYSTRPTRRTASRSRSSDLSRLNLT